jgi:hypothetical protein
MTGGDNFPLLILADAGKGRTGLLLSDQFWIWTRGGDHAGPALPLLRRIVHWLLREPALEAETLTASVVNQHLLINRQTLSADYPGDATVTAPNGGVSHIALSRTSAGHLEASIPATPMSGAWKITEGNLTAYAASTASNTVEYHDLAATAANLRGAARHIIWLGNTPAPQLGTLISPRHAVQITGTRSVPLLPPLPTLLAALSLIIAAWWRENSTRS